MMDAASYYVHARNVVECLGYMPEIEWQIAQDPSAITESEFLREAAWVVYCSGFRESVVRKYFDYLSLSFCDWESAESIVENSSGCVTAAMQVLRHERKHQAVVEIARNVAQLGFDEIKRRVQSAPLRALQGLPFIGPVTVLHLAKNLGFDVAKPDRHLVRLPRLLGYSEVYEMCRSIADFTGDPLRVVDLVLWRYSEREAAMARAG